MTIHLSHITAVILAGGKGRRLGGQDKGLVEFQGQRLIDRILESITPQVYQVIISANRNIDTYTALGHKVICDDMTNFQGPLAGFATAMQACETDYIVTMPCDGPFLEENYVQRLAKAIEVSKNISQSKTQTIAVAHDGERLQPVHALIPVSLKGSLLAFLESGDRKIDRWYAQHDMIEVDFSDSKAMFFNINTEEQRQLAAHKKDRHD